MDYLHQTDGGANTYICTECGDGFRVYSALLSHLTIHGPLDSFSLDGSFNGFDVAREYMLHDNGTLTVVDRSGQTNGSSNCKPVSPILENPIPSEPVYSFKSKIKERVTSKPPIDNSTPKTYGCETCSESFSSLRSLQQHQQYRKTEEGHKCTLCCKVFSDREKLKGHLVEHAHERFYCCGHCGKRFLKLEGFYVHQKEQHKSPGSKSVNKSDRNQGNSAEKTYSCKKCNLHFFWLSDLQSHSLSHCKEFTRKEFSKPPTPGDKVQPLLNKTSHNSLNNNISINLKTEGDMASETQSCFRPYRCGLCGDRFQQLANLKLHHYSHQSKRDIDQTLPKGKKPTVASPSKGRGRPAHIKRPPGSESHPCKYCHRVFNHSSSLSRHMRYHKGTLHTCVFFGRHFPQRCDVRRHIAMYHKKELEKKPWLKYLALHTKPEADAETLIKSTEHKFKRYSDVAELVGDDERRTKQQSKASKPRVTYKCQECGKKFGLQCVYQRHLRYHKRQPTSTMFKCPQCPSFFKQATALKRHLDNHPIHLEVFTDEQRSRTGFSQDPDLKQDDTAALEDDETIEDVGGDLASSVLYECTECTETFSCLQRFLQHQTSHGSDNIK